MTQFAFQQARAIDPQAATCQTIEALPGCVNLAFYEGDDVFIDLTVKDPDGLPTDLTGATATAQVRSRTDSDEVLATFTGTVAGNVVHLQLPNTENVDMPDSAVWDCQIEQGGAITTLVAGTVTITQEVTRA